MKTMKTVGVVSLEYNLISFRHSNPFVFSVARDPMTEDDFNPA
jgi:hypothetical protein